MIPSAEQALLAIQARAARSPADPDARLGIAYG
jgi:hypothetical protein